MLSNTKTNKLTKTNKSNVKQRKTSSSNNKVSKKSFKGIIFLRNIDLDNPVKNFNKKTGNYLGSGAYGDVFFLRDKHGNENSDYAVKFVRNNIGARFEAQLVKFLKKSRLVPMKGYAHNFDENFRVEVKALKKLKGQGIGPEIVFANYKKYYYVIERMDKELYKMWKSKELTHFHILQLLALCDRYIRSPFFHEDLHLNNVMWSERLNDFRIIDWGITLFIGDSLTSETTTNRKLNDLFYGSLMWAIMIYTLYNVNKGGADKEKWLAIKEKISKYIATRYPHKIKKYDIFSPEYTGRPSKGDKSRLKSELKALDNKSLFGNKQKSPSKSRSKSNKSFYLK